jgi:solute carrier family 25 S-adenosylmethionine transporter 26
MHLLLLTSPLNTCLLYYCVDELFFVRETYRRLEAKRVLFRCHTVSICFTVSSMRVSRASAVFVGVYEPVKHKLIDAFPDHLSAVAHLTAGAVGGAAASLIRVPTEVVKQRMQTLQFSSAPSAVRVIVAKEGFSGLYAGFGAFLLRDLPFDAIQFCLYEQVRIIYRRTVKRELYDPENAVMGALAGAITGAVTTPLDVIKTRLMVQGSKGHYKGVIDCVAKIIKEEGSEALLKGVGPRVMWIGIGGSIFFTALERTKGQLAQLSWSKGDDFPHVRTA